MKQYFKLIIETIVPLQPKRAESFWIHGKTLQIIHKPGIDHLNTVYTSPEFGFEYNFKSKLRQSPITHAYDGGWIRANEGFYDDTHHILLQGNSEEHFKNVVSFLRTSLKDKKFEIDILPPFKSKDIHDGDTLKTDADVDRYLTSGHKLKEAPSITEQWSEYDIKVGETNTSLFDPNNKSFNMKAFLRRIRKKNRVRGKLAEE